MECNLNINWVSPTCICQGSFSQVHHPHYLSSQHTCDFRKRRELFFIIWLLLSPSLLCSVFYRIVMVVFRAGVGKRDWDSGWWCQCYLCCLFGIPNERATLSYFYNIECLTYHFLQLGAVGKIPFYMLLCCSPIYSYSLCSQMGAYPLCLKYHSQGLWFLNLFSNTGVYPGLSLPPNLRKIFWYATNYKPNGTLTFSIHCNKIL